MHPTMVTMRSDLSTTLRSLVYKELYVPPGVRFCAIFEERALKDNYWRQLLRDKMKITLAIVVCVIVVLLLETKPSLGQVQDFFVIVVLAIHCSSYSLFSQACMAPTCLSGTLDLDSCECTTVQPATCSGTLMPSDAMCSTVSSPQCSGGCSLDQTDCSCSPAGTYIHTIQTRVLHSHVCT